MCMTVRERLWPHVSVKYSTVATLFLLSQLIFQVKLVFNCSLKGLNLLPFYDFMKGHKKYPWGNLWPWEKQKEIKSNGFLCDGNLMPAVIQVLNLHKAITSVSDKLLWRFHSVSIYGFFLNCLSLICSRFDCASWWSPLRYKEQQWGGTRTLFPLLPDLFRFCGSLRFRWGFDKVLSDHLILTQPPDAALDHSEDLL